MLILGSYANQYTFQNVFVSSSSIFLLILLCFPDFLSCCVMEFYLMSYCSVLPFTFNIKFAARENNLMI